MSELRVGDYGTILRVTIKEGTSIVDLSATTVRTIKLTKPSGVKSSFPASFTTNGTDGKIQYTVTPGLLDESGMWKIRAYIETPTGGWHTKATTFGVAAV